MSARCVCTHIKALHRDGKCMAVVEPCGCTLYETPEQAQKPTSLVGIDHYEGRYSGRKYRP